jgi:hypothetical protein
MRFVKRFIEEHRQPLTYVVGLAGYALALLSSIKFTVGGFVVVIGVTTGALFLFEFLKLFVRSGVLKKVLENSPFIDGVYCAWCVTSGLALLPFDSLAGCSLFFLIIAMPSLRGYMSSRLGLYRAARIDAIVSMIIIAYAGYSFAKAI